MIDFTCPLCCARLSVDDGLAGRTILCRECDEHVRVPAAPPTPAPAPPQAIATEATAPRPAPALVRQIMAVVCWAGCIGWTALVLSNHVVTHTESAIQQAALAAESCLWIVAGYVAARAAHAILGAVSEGAGPGK